VNDRDFCANDDIQVKLQNASYQTQVWYEKRRDEFRETPRGVKKVPNHVLANVYLAYQLQDPVSVIKNYSQRARTSKDLNFISHKDHKDGLYEKIFNKDTSFNDMLCAFYVFDAVNATTPFSYQDTFKTNVYHLLALFKVAFTKYLQSKHGNTSINVNREIIKQYEAGNKEVIIKTFKFLNDFVEKQVEVADDESKTTERMFKFLFTLSHYEKIKEQLEDTELKPADIENIAIKDKEAIIEGEIDEQSEE
jgi:hypothetical protein